MNPSSVSLLNRRLVYVGTYNEPVGSGAGATGAERAGIYLLALDIASGALEPLDAFAGAANPSYLALDGAHRFLYAVNELQEFAGAACGAVSAYAVDQDNGRLTFLNRQPSGGTDPCHLQVDSLGKHVAVANYTGGSVCVLPIGDDGALGEATDFVQHAGASVDPARQAGPHAHCAVFDPAGRHLLVADLGLDQVAVYPYDAQRGTLAPRRDLWAAAAAGAGPRHLALHPRNGLVYALNELDSTVTVYSYNAATGTLAARQTVATLPADFGGENTGAAVQVSPAGKFLYASNRGHDSIAVFAIDEQDGALTPVEHVPTQGRTPRDCAISPDGRYLIAANQDDNRVVTFKIDAQSGQLLPTGYAAEVPFPACVQVISAPPGAAV